jgi:hypothetical protein
MPAHPSLESFATHCTEYAKGIFPTEPDGELTPQWVLEDAGGDIYVFVTPFGDNDSKDVVAMMIRMEVEKKKIRRLALISEAWTVHIPAKGSANVNEAIARHLPGVAHGASLASHPERREIMFVNCAERDGGEVQKSFAILHPENQNKRVLAESAGFDAMDKFEGRFTHMFEEPPIGDLLRVARLLGLGR